MGTLAPPAHVPAADPAVAASQPSAVPTAAAPTAAAPTTAAPVAADDDVEVHSVADVVCAECGEGPDSPFVRGHTLYFNSPGDLLFYCEDCWKAYYGAAPPASAQAFGGSKHHHRRSRR